VSNYRRFIIGGIGGLAPVLMFLIAVDWEEYVVGATTLKVVGYCVRVIVLFGVGGFVAYLHSDERTPFKLFEIGLGAPALIAGYITTSLVSISAPHINPNTSRTVGFSVVSTVHAQTVPPSHQLKKFTLPEQSPTGQFLQGLIGVAPKNVWFVIVGSHLKVEDANSQADSINKAHGDFRAEVYAPYGDNPYYAVVIGAHLTQKEAKALRDKAVNEGLPKDSYYKTFPNLPPPQR
jgi:hypothetical protein